jgi:hypothetical protein
MLHRFAIKRRQIGIHNHPLSGYQANALRNIAYGSAREREGQVSRFPF